MVFNMISLGLGDAKDITVRGLEIVKKCERLYLECYTAILGINAAELEEFYGKKIIIADRHMVERDADIIMADSDKVDVGFLVVGDVFAATTHHDIYLRAVNKGYPVAVVNNASIMNAVACCGLQLYTFGLTVSICFFDGTWRPYSYYEKFKTNYKNGMHTLCLLDIKVKEQTPEHIAKNIEVYQPPRFMTINQAIEQLFETEDELETGCLTRDSWAIGMARVGQATQKIVAGPLNKLIDVDFGAPLHSLVLPGPNLHPLEVEMIFHYWYDQENKAAALQAYTEKQEAERMAAIERRLEEDRKQREQRRLEREAEEKRKKEALLKKQQQPTSSDDDSSDDDSSDSE